jgi:hypothetical protein
MSDQKQLREHLLELLGGGSAHVNVESALKDFPLDRLNERPTGSPHSAWDLLEHIRLAQRDILGFSRAANHVSPDFPDGYWPKGEGTPESWQNSVRVVLSDLDAMRKLVADESIDLLSPSRTATDKRYSERRCLSRTTTPITSGR